MGAYCNIEGIDELLTAGQKLAQKVENESRSFLLSQAKIIRDRIKEKVPKGPTGNLKRGAYAVIMPRSPVYPEIAVAGINPRIAPHGHLVEYGHGGPHPAPPHPFFRPAVDEVRNQVMANIREAVKKTIDKAV